MTNGQDRGAMNSERAGTRDVTRTAAVVWPARLARRRTRSLKLTVGAVAVATVLVAAQPATPSAQHWLATWTTSPQSASPDPDDPLLAIDGQTVRQRMRVSIGGEELRVRLSNEFGAEALHIGAATVGVASDPASVRPGSIRALTFGGRPSVTIPPGAPALSDPVAFVLEPGAELSISLYFPGPVKSPTVHPIGLKRAVVTPRGNFTQDVSVQTAATSESSMVATAVLVATRAPYRLVLALGDSIADGVASSVDADRGWTSVLARRAASQQALPVIAVANAGIAGNRLLRSGDFGQGALARFDRDVLSVPGVTHVVVHQGINDIGFAGAKVGNRYLADPSEVVTSQDLISAYQQLIVRARARGIKVIGATLTPFEGTSIPGYYSEAKEMVREQVNTWIRTSGAFDGVIDFDAILRDPEQPRRLQARYASRDKLHPNDAGYQAMAEAIDLTLFR